MTRTGIRRWCSALRALLVALLIATAAWFGVGVAGAADYSVGFNPVSGTAGKTITVTSPAFFKDCTVLTNVAWAGVAAPGKGTRTATGATLVVPDIPAGTYTVTLTCGMDDPDGFLTWTGQGSFTVRDAPALRISPGEGSAGLPIVATATGFPTNCKPTMTVGGTGVDTTVRDPSGPDEQVFGFTVPDTLAPGTALVRLSCGADTATTSLNVLVTKSSTDPPTSGSGPTSTLGQPDPTTTPIPREGTDPALSSRPDFPRALSTPAQVSWSAGSILTSFLVFAFLFAVVGFPAELFNKTLEENRHRLPAWWRRDPPPDEPPRTRWLQVAGYVVGSALLLSLVEAGAGFNVQTLVLAVALLLAVPLTTLAYSGTVELHLRRADRTPATLSVLPLGIAVAVVCVVMSRVANFQPGYAYGLFAFFAAGAAGRARRAGREGPSVLLGAAILLALGVAAWLVWPPIAAAADQPDAGPLVLVSDSALAATFVLALQGVLFGLAPIDYLDGKKLWSWSWLAWTAVWGVALFLFVHVLFWKFLQEFFNVGQVVAALVPFLLFGLVSTGLWLYLRWTSVSGSTPDRS